MLGNVYTMMARLCRSTPPSKSGAPAVSHSIRLWRLRWAAIVLVSLAATSVGWTIWQLRNDAIRTTVSETGNIATVLADQLSRSLQAIDAVLLEVKRSTKSQDIDPRGAAWPAIETRAFHDSLME
jgi:hypothetical protein